MSGMKVIKLASVKKTRNVVSYSIELNYVMDFHCSKRGFSLIELLVVVAIISLLVSILLPSLNQAKELARKTVCSSKLHQIGLAMSLYGNEYDNCFPPAFLSDWSREWPSWIFTRDELNASPEERITQCPSVGDHPFYGHVGITYGYDFRYKGFGIYLSKPNVFITNRFEEAVSPSECPILCCGSFYLVYANDGSSCGDDWTNLGHHPEYVHLGTSNLIFIDGHVTSMPPAELEREVIWQLYPNQTCNPLRWIAAP